MPDALLISVIMPVHNAERYVEAAIHSILEQTFGDFEFIIIDDGSTDGSVSLAKAIAAKDGRIRFFQQDNKGVTATLNRGLSFARGKYIARMDADDICLPNRLELQLNFLENNQDHVLVAGHVGTARFYGLKSFLAAPFSRASWRLAYCAVRGR